MACGMRHIPPCFLCQVKLVFQDLERHLRRYHPDYGQWSQCSLACWDYDASSQNNASNNLNSYCNSLSLHQHASPPPPCPPKSANQLPPPPTPAARTTTSVVPRSPVARPPQLPRGEAPLDLNQPKSQATSRNPISMNTTYFKPSSANHIPQQSSPGFRSDAPAALKSRPPAVAVVLSICVCSSG